MFQTIGGIIIPTVNPLSTGGATTTRRSDCDNKMDALQEPPCIARWDKHRRRSIIQSLFLEIDEDDSIEMMLNDYEEEEIAASRTESPSKLSNKMSDDNIIATSFLFNSENTPSFRNKSSFYPPLSPPNVRRLPMPLCFRVIAGHDTEEKTSTNDFSFDKRDVTTPIVPKQRHYPLHRSRAPATYPSGKLFTKEDDDEFDEDNDYYFLTKDGTSAENFKRNNTVSMSDDDDDNDSLFYSYSDDDEGEKKEDNNVQTKYPSIFETASHMSCSLPKCRVSTVMEPRHELFLKWHEQWMRRINTSTKMNHDKKEMKRRNTTIDFASFVPPTNKHKVWEETAHIIPPLRRKSIHIATAA